MNAQDLKNAQILGKLAISVLYEGKWSAMCYSKSRSWIQIYIPFPSISFWITKDHNLPHKIPFFFTMFASVCSFMFFPYNWTLMQQNPSPLRLWGMRAPQLCNWSALRCHPRLPGSTSFMLYTLSCKILLRMVKKCMTNVSIKTLEGNPPFETYWNWNHVLHQPVQNFIWLLIHFKRSLHNDLPTSLHGTWLHQKGWLSLSHIWQVSCLCHGTQTTDLKINCGAEIAVTHLHPKSTQCGHATIRKVFHKFPDKESLHICMLWSYAIAAVVCERDLGETGQCVTGIFASCHSGSMLIVQPTSFWRFCSCTRWNLSNSKNILKKCKNVQGSFPFREPNMCSAHFCRPLCTHEAGYQL